MAPLKCTGKSTKALDFYDVWYLGYNLLENADLSVTDRETGETPEMKLNLIYNKNALEGIITRENLKNHIDVFANSADFVFDMKKSQKIEKILFTSFFAPNANYTVGEFAIFASNDRETLFDDSNMVAHEEGGKNWTSGKRNHADWLYDTEGSCRFLGLRVFKANETDDIIRPENFAVFNSENTEKRKYIDTYFGKNALKGLEPKKLTSGIAFEDNALFQLKAGENLKFSLENEKVFTNLNVITKGEANLSCGGEVPEGKPIIYGRYLYTFKNSVEGEIVITALEDAEIDYVTADTSYKEASVNFNDTIVEDFYGIGADVLPMAFMPESLKTGYNDVYWEMERRRINLVRPHVIRLWFQPDWLVETYEQYKNGDYNFDAEKMYSVYKYLDAFKEAGCEIEFDFGWKVSSHAQEWFSFPETPQKSASAPKELDLFAKCCAATLKELIFNRGYDNIKYLTFYNEPDYAHDAPDRGDFIVIGTPRKVYWEKMLRMCRAELDNAGLSDIKMWCCEQSGCNEDQKEWMNYFEENCSDVLDVHTSHRYQSDSANNKEYLKMLNEGAKTKPVVITECGQCYSNEIYSFDQNHVQFFCELANAGISGALIWCLSGVAITDPCSFTMRNFIDMWDSLQFDGAIDNVREVYYEWAMLCRYIPNHCKSVRTKVDCGNDMRCCAFKIGEDDYTVVVELDSAGSERNIKLNLGENIGKKMYRHIYKRPYSRNGNATLPPVSKEISVHDTLCDTVGGDYMEIVYTTLPPVHQIELGSTEIFLSPGENYRLSARNIDGFGAIDWEITAQIGDGFEMVGLESLIKVSEDAKPGDMCAVKAYSVGNPEVYSIVIVKVK